MMTRLLTAAGLALLLVQGPVPAEASVTSESVPAIQA